MLPKGYRFSGVYSGVKRDASKLDLSLLVSDLPATAAGVYTTNLVCGAPVQVDRSRTPGTGFRAVVTNSGCANACTGERGIRDAEEMAGLAAKAIGADPEKALVMSTGVIGEFLPLEKISAGITKAASQLGNDQESFLAAARGMLTTDTVHKISQKQVTLESGETVTIAGMCKGAAMIAPNLATMLVVIFTDATLVPEVSQPMLFSAVEETFNCITVEGHTSTSDTVLFLANGAASQTPIVPGTKDYEKFSILLGEVCLELARSIPADGEGVTHLVTVDVKGCRDRNAAKTIARKVAEDVLVKTAIAGADPNWGRIVSATGSAKIPFDTTKVGLHLNGFELYRDGIPVKFDSAAVSTSMRENREISIVLTFGEGDANIRFWTTDLTEEYVHLNADYHT